MPRNSLVLAAALAASLAAGVAAADAISVSGLRHTVDKSYRRMMEGAALFERLHALAPEASLRYRLLPRKAGTSLRGIELAVIGDSFEFPVAIASDDTFALERNDQAMREDASVRPNRRVDSMTWRADVRTPGLPAGVRRLGDLRLECKVGMRAGLVSHYPSVIGWLLGSSGDDPAVCDSPESPYLFFADRPIFGVVLESAGRRQALSVRRLYAGIAAGETPKEDLPYCDCEALLDRAYELPLGDASWPDDARVELQYMDSPGGEPAMKGWSKRAVHEAIGTAGRVMRFESGYEVWVYTFGDTKGGRPGTELVLLFDRSGTLSADRLRPARA
ncbi:MAG: hypothetical protein JO035_17475 [Betaproteobacteria bacterium]|nr:hypothetical protein [Betaproteobacteria bacterium]